MGFEELERATIYVDQLEAHMDEGGGTAANNVRDLMQFVRTQADAIASLRRRAELAESEVEVANNAMRELGKQLADTGRRAESAEAERDACHEVWRDFRAKLATVIPDIDSWPLFHGAETIVIQLAEANRRADENWKMWEDNAMASAEAVTRSIVLEEQLAAAQARETALVSLLDRFRSFVLDYATQWQMTTRDGKPTNHHNPIWQEVAEALAGPAQGREPNLVECDQCGGSGFGTPGTGYDNVCGKCGGQKVYPAPTATPPGGDRCIHDPPLCARPNASEDACQAPHCFAPGGEPTQAGEGEEKHPLRDRLHDIVLRELRNLSRDSSDNKRALFIVSGLMANAARLFYRPTQAGAGGEDARKIGEALGLFASCIKSGEDWSEQCERARKGARDALARLTRARDEGRAEGMEEACEIIDTLRNGYSWEQIIAAIRARKGHQPTNKRDDK